MESRFRLSHLAGSHAVADAKTAKYRAAFLDMIYGEITLAITLVVCMTIVYDANTSTYGVSYYGVHLDTAWILATGFAVTAFFVYRGALALDQHHPWGLMGITLRVVAVGLPTLVLTPYTAGTFFNWAHMVIGTAVFGFQMFTGVIMAAEVLRDLRGMVAVAIQFGGGVAAALSLPNHMLHFMLQGEIVFQIGFCLLANRVLLAAIRSGTGSART